MRLFAKHKGLVLNSTGLYYGRESSRKGESKLVAEGRVEGSAGVTCEEDIFKLLGLAYIDPREREAGMKELSWGALECCLVRDVRGVWRCGYAFVTLCAVLLRRMAFWLCALTTRCMVLM
eukprot:3479615-Rhodomonas_salina.2